MPRVDSIERRIAQVEGFEVRIMLNGADSRGNLDLPVHYPMYSRRANESSTVHGVEGNRFPAQLRRA